MLLEPPAIIDALADAYGTVTLDIEEVPGVRVLVLDEWPQRVSFWHAAGTTAFHMGPDLHEHRSHIDMQKIMMAVLVAMQEERDRLEAESESAGQPGETPS